MTGKTSTPGPSERQPGQLIFPIGELVGGHYEVLRMLGEGGMGQVFEALDHLLNRKVAIKVAWPNPHVPPLRNEARALAAFRHPSLVTVHTLGEHRGTDYLVMERIYGVSLAEQLDRHRAQEARFSPDEVIELMVHIAEGLAVVHRAGLAHRDVKPDNIMLTPDQRVVLMDFGLVLTEVQAGTQSTVAGSPPYMAPEAIANRTSAGNAHLADLYALGVLGFELLTGQLPIRAQTLPELWEKHQSEPVPRVHQYRPDVPGALDGLIASLMAKRPEERPQSAEASVFRLRNLPPEPRETAAPASAAREPKRYDVLIVDDNDDIARILDFYVKRALGDVDVRRATDGVNALERIDEHTPDLMLLDLHMPKMNGIELCMHLRGEGIAPDTTIISVSAGAQKDDRQLLHQLGIHHIIEKGAGLKERLANVLKEVCGVDPTTGARPATP